MCLISYSYTEEYIGGGKVLDQNKLWVNYASEIERAWVDSPHSNPVPIRL